MNPQPYNELSDLPLLELCVWREARSEPFDGKRAVAWVIKNRSARASWWNEHIAGSLSRVILHPYQFSSFNATDPQRDKWPNDSDPVFADCCAAAIPVYTGDDDADPTLGATYYYDTSIEWPSAWGEQSEFVNTLNIGRLRFWRTVVHTTDAHADDL
jgi:spore germination cell wall hydrolase CwlJ-like protein